MARIGIIGSEGRMGQALREAVAAAGHEYAGGVDKDAGDIVRLSKESDVLVDFSSPAALEASLDAALAALTPIVVGTTGLEERHHWLLDEAAKTIPVLQTGNTSLGVNLLAHLVQEAASRLGEDRRKVDAPSGTALLLGEAAARGRGITLGNRSERGRDGITGAREAGAIGFASLRGGSVAGDHTVYLLADDERLALSHLAENRGIFARGAVKAAGWLVGQEAGRYTMKEVLGL